MFTFSVLDGALLQPREEPAPLLPARGPGSGTVVPVAPGVLGHRWGGGGHGLGALMPHTDVSLCRTCLVTTGKHIVLDISPLLECIVFPWGAEVLPASPWKWKMRTHLFGQIWIVPQPPCCPSSRPTTAPHPAASVGREAHTWPATPAKAIC